MAGDADLGSAPIVRVSEPGHQAQALQPLDQLSHRRLADPFLGGQRRKPNGPFAANPVHRIRGGRAQIGAVSQKPRRQVHCLIEKLADAVAGVFISRLLPHTVSISCGLCSGNPDQGFAAPQPLHRAATVPEGGMRASCRPACGQRHHTAHS